MSELLEEIRKTLVNADSLLSLLVHRHGTVMEQIGEREEAKKIYEKCRTLATTIDFSSLTPDKRKEVNNLVSIMLELKRSG